MIVLFFVLPAGNALVYSVIDFDGIDNPPFVGLANFTEMFTDPGLARAGQQRDLDRHRHGRAAGARAVRSPCCCGRVRRGSRFYRLRCSSRTCMPGVAIGIAWGWIYDPIHGWLNVALRAVGPGFAAHGLARQPVTRRSTPSSHGDLGRRGFVMLIFLSALQNVDIELIDAARLDGAERPCSASGTSSCRRSCRCS